MHIQNRQHQLHLKLGIGILWQRFGEAPARCDVEGGGCWLLWYSPLNRRCHAAQCRQNFFGRLSRVVRDGRPGCKNGPAQLTLHHQPPVTVRPAFAEAQPAPNSRTPGRYPPAPTKTMPPQPVDIDDDEPPSLVPVDPASAEVLPEELPHEKVPITIVTGYLGAGSMFPGSLV